MSGPSQRITFVGSQRAELAARLDLPAGPPRAYALFAHCFTCSKDIFAAGRIAAELNRQGFAVLRFDFTGLGASGGDFGNTDFSSNIEDLWLAAGWMSDNLHAPQVLVGHSLGGAAAIAVANDIPSVRAVATIGAPASVDHITRLFAERLDDIETAGEANVSIAGRAFCIRQSFLDDLTNYSIADRVQSLRPALLVAHAPDDSTVSIENGENLFRGGALSESVRLARRCRSSAHTASRCRVRRRSNRDLGSPLHFE